MADRAAALAAIQQQRQELDALLAQTTKDLNTVAGHERLGKWKAKTVALFEQQVGPAEAKKLQQSNPGPSFTSDFLDEFTDNVDHYCTILSAIQKDVQNRPA